MRALAEVYDVTTDSKADGTLVAWSGALLRSIPTGLSNVTAIAASTQHQERVLSYFGVAAGGQQALGDAVGLWAVAEAMDERAVRGRDYGLESV